MLAHQTAGTFVAGHSVPGQFQQRVPGHTGHPPFIGDVPVPLVPLESRCCLNATQLPSGRGS